LILFRDYLLLLLSIVLLYGPVIVILTHIHIHPLTCRMIVFPGMVAHTQISTSQIFSILYVAYTYMHIVVVVQSCTEREIYDGERVGARVFSVYMCVCEVDCIRINSR